jgi:hypothetical protein
VSFVNPTAAQPARNTPAIFKLCQDGNFNRYSLKANSGGCCVGLFFEAKMACSTLHRPFPSFFFLLSSLPFLLPFAAFLFVLPRICVKSRARTSGVNGALFSPQPKAPQAAAP